MTVLAGTLSTGGAGDLFNANDLTATARTASVSGTADTMRATLATSAGASITFIVYADSAGVPGAKLGQSASQAVVNGTNTGLLLAPVTINSGTVYWIGFWCTGATVNLTDNTPGGYKGHNVTPLPDPFGSIVYSDATNSLPVTIEDTGLFSGPAPEKLIVVHAGIRQG